MNDSLNLFAIDSEDIFSEYIDESLQELNQKLIELEQVAITCEVENDEQWSYESNSPYTMDRTFSEVQCEIEDTINLITEKSHGTLKYTYRLGIDVATGKQVAVEFYLDTEQIADIGDQKNITEPMVKKLTQGKASDSSISKWATKYHSQATDMVKSTIKRYGHIDHRTKALKVHAIFDIDKKSHQSIRMIPVFSKNFTRLVDAVAQKTNQSASSRTELIQSNTFRKEFLNYINNQHAFPPNSIETYEVGKFGGENKYKSTKLFWNLDKMLSYVLVPSIRGYVGDNLMSKDKHDRLEAEYISTGMNTRPSKGNMKL